MDELEADHAEKYKKGEQVPMAACVLGLQLEEPRDVAAVPHDGMHIDMPDPRRGIRIWHEPALSRHGAHGCCRCRHGGRS